MVWDPRHWVACTGDPEGYTSTLHAQGACTVEPMRTEGADPGEEDLGRSSGPGGGGAASGPPQTRPVGLKHFLAKPSVPPVVCIRGT